MSSPTFLYILGTILLICGIGISAYLFWRRSHQKTEFAEGPSEDETMQRAFSIIDNLPDSKRFSAILLEQGKPEQKLLHIIDELFTANLIVQATKASTLLTEFAPDFPAGYARLGKCYLKAGNYEKAETALRKALELDENDKKTANNLSYIFNKTKRYEQTVEILEKFAHEDNKDLITLMNLGIAFFHVGQKDMAFDLFNSAYKINPNMPEVHLYIGHCLKEFGQTEKANLAYRRYKALTESKTAVPQQSREQKDTPQTAAKTNSTVPDEEIDLN